MMKNDAGKNSFLDDEDGAASVEWVVIAGFVVALALSVVAALSPDLTGKIPAALGLVSISETF